MAIQFRGAHPTGRRAAALFITLALWLVQLPGLAHATAGDAGIINFFMKDHRVRFAINRQAAESAGLRISSRLLRLARVVTSEDARP
jgi:hypothetical protein